MIGTNDIIMFIQIFVIMTLMILTAKYLYCEKCFVTRKSWIIFGSVFLCAEIGALLVSGELGQELMILILLVSFSVMIMITRKKRRFRGMFLIFPVMGIIMSIEMIPSMILDIFSEKSIYNLSENVFVYELIYDIVLYTVICIWLKKKITFSKLEISIWERRILNGNGVLLLVIYCISTSIPKTLSQYEQYLLSGGVVIAIMIIGTSIIMTVQSMNANNYKMKSEINEHYLQAQLNHFRAYQETQKETRRIRHDMKNHMIGINALYERGDYEALGDYLKELTELTQKIDKEYHIGNDMADAILNEKFSNVKQQEIDLLIEGSMVGINGIAPIDVCTIFANAIDNAIDAIHKLNLNKATITISIKRNNKIMVISFTNPCVETHGVKQKEMKTSKNDSINHGFGLENMRIAADKYNGNVEINIIEDENGQKLFCLEVMIIVKVL